MIVELTALRRNVKKVRIKKKIEKKYKITFLPVFKEKLAQRGKDFHCQD